jgi:hypothetical protein
MEKRMARTPEFRDDTLGNLKSFIDDCTCSMRAEIANAEFFIMALEDCTDSIKEWSPYLTDAELQRCFKAAKK